MTQPANHRDFIIEKSRKDKIGRNIEEHQQEMTVWKNIWAFFYSCSDILAQIPRENADFKGLCFVLIDLFIC